MEGGSGGHTGATTNVVGGEDQIGPYIKKHLRKKGKLLGQGGFGSVWKLRLATGELVALKLLEGDSPTAQAVFHAELAHLVSVASAASPYVVALKIMVEDPMCFGLEFGAFGVCGCVCGCVCVCVSAYLSGYLWRISDCLEVSLSHAHTHTHTHSYDAAEHGNLTDFMASEHWDSSFEAQKKCILHIAKGLLTCHESGVVHHDLKPDNVLVFDQLEYDDTRYPFRFALTDFGVSKNFAECFNLDTDKTGGNALSSLHASLSAQDERLFASADTTRVLAGDVGTPQFFAPERYLAATGEISTLQKSLLDPTKSDIFALGITMWSVATTKRPFETTPPTLVAKLIAQKASFRPGTNDLKLPAWYLDLMRSCWAASPFDRPDAATVIALLVSDGESRVLSQFDGAGGAVDIVATQNAAFGTTLSDLTGATGSSIVATESGMASGVFPPAPASMAATDSVLSDMESLPLPPPASMGPDELGSEVVPLPPSMPDVSSVLQE
jgi:serine/threonine protein kinase